MFLQEIGPLLVGVTVVFLYFVLAIVLFIIALAGLLNKKTSHFEPTMYIIIDLGLTAWVIYSIIQSPLTKEVLSNLF